MQTPTSQGMDSRDDLENKQILGDINILVFFLLCNVLVLG